MTDSAVTDLPEPDSPTTATVSPRPIVNDRSRTAVDDALGRRELDREAGDVDDARGREGRRGGARYPRSGVERQTFSGSRAGRFISNAGIGRCRDSRAQCCRALARAAAASLGRAFRAIGG